ncbi:hypothetical protein N665_0614s0013 [Sinapis alba]|nr:hypothetical protein N665_0614s0013 [Sinapis alba]
MVYGLLSWKVLNFELIRRYVVMKMLIFFFLKLLRKHWRFSWGDVLHWIRQVVGLLCGLVWGSIPLAGGIWLLLLMKKTMGVMQLCSRMVYLLL